MLAKKDRLIKGVKSFFMLTALIAVQLFPSVFSIHLLLSVLILIFCFLLADIKQPGSYRIIKLSVCKIE